jgi:hypothetical protein
MKESQIIQKRIEALEADLATAKQVLAEVTREEAANGTHAERREYALELYKKILTDYDDMDIESDAVDGFIEQVINQEHRAEIVATLSETAYFGSRPIIQVCDETTLTKIIDVLEACIDYIEDNGVLDMWLIYDPETCTIINPDEMDDEEEPF